MTDLCPICSDNEVEVKTPCGHEFCEECITEWITTVADDRRQMSTWQRDIEADRLNCPICRAPLCLNGCNHDEHNAIRSLQNIEDIDGEETEEDDGYDFGDFDNNISYLENFENMGIDPFTIVTPRDEEERELLRELSDYLGFEPDNLREEVRNEITGLNYNNRLRGTEVFQMTQNGTHYFVKPASDPIYDDARYGHEQTPMGKTIDGYTIWDVFKIEIPSGEHNWAERGYFTGDGNDNSWVLIPGNIHDDGYGNYTWRTTEHRVTLRGGKKKSKKSMKKGGKKKSKKSMKKGGKKKKKDCN